MKFSDLPKDADLGMSSETPPVKGSSDPVTETKHWLGPQYWKIELPLLAIVLTTVLSALVGWHNRTSQFESVIGLGYAYGQDWNLPSTTRQAKAFADEYYPQYIVLEAIELEPEDGPRGLTRRLEAFWTIWQRLRTTVLMP